MLARSASTSIIFHHLGYSAGLKATDTVSFWGDRGYPSICFEYKMASERYLVAEI